MTRTIKSFQLKGAEKFIGPIAALLGFVFMLQWYIHGTFKPSVSDPVFQVKQPPLIMKGGDPYIRALMRTISASEANDPRPYSILYGGKHIDDLSRHPQQCITIVNGPNKGNCSTAAGRYQVINTTWYDIARRYHPQPNQFMWWTNYSFEAQYQDAVVYRWLSDSKFWGTNFSQSLRQGKVKDVLRHLSPTWTSLGYGIENNSMSRHLPKIYQKMLKEELQQATGGQGQTTQNPQTPNPKTQNPQTQNRS